MVHFLSQNKLAYLWGKLTNYFIAKVGDASITGNVYVSGNISSSGSINCIGDMAIDGKTIKSVKNLTLESDSKYDLDKAASGTTYLFHYYDLTHFKASVPIKLGNIVTLTSSQYAYCTVWKNEIAGVDYIVVLLDGVVAVAE